MSSNTPNYESARPRKHRSYPYRLPLGAFACILIWFFAVLMDGNDKPEQQVQWENLPQATAAAKPFKVYDFQASSLDAQTLDEDIADAIHYYGLVTRKTTKPVAEAQILLPDSFPYQSFIKVLQTSKKEHLQLAFGKERQLILRKKEK